MVFWNLCTTDCTDCCTHITKQSWALKLKTFQEKCFNKTTDGTLCNFFPFFDLRGGNINVKKDSIVVHKRCLLLSCFQNKM